MMKTKVATFYLGSHGVYAKISRKR